MKTSEIVDRLREMGGSYPISVLITDSIDDDLRYPEYSKFLVDSSESADVVAECIQEEFIDKLSCHPDEEFDDKLTELYNIISEKFYKFLSEKFSASK